MSTAVESPRAPQKPQPSGPTRPVWKRWWFGLVSVLVVLGIIGTVTGGDGSPTAAPVAPTTLSEATTTATVTQPLASATSSPEPSTPPTSVSPTSATASPTSQPPVPRGTALAALATLTVKGRAAGTGYAREQFGPAWADVDRNGCDTRNDILRRDLDRFYLKAETHGCLVLKGTLRDPYTGNTLTFVRGAATSSQVQIDHVVALSDAWQKGAQQASAETREKLANDPLNLLAVNGPTNEAKGNGDAATWLPPNKSFRCAYVARQVAVKAKYNLWVTPAEKSAITNILDRCPGQKLPTSSRIALGGGTVISPPVTPAPTKTAAPPKPPAPSGLDPRFDTCKAAIAAGYGPYHEGKDPEYDWYRDSDSDGVVCE
ncbi:GmrSD restriction endonuclease domain-containing protein [Terrabacter sp. 2RAF25]|uniref:GmrSD restriction endonuclease domain-containing protein n=1 Tax=Terrabacter sp. 2RAF25 TaxID=3232998 RepID=UPI003F977CF7